MSSLSHVLVPKHEILSEKEREAVFESFNLKPAQVPVISVDDAGIEGLKPKVGDLVKITRNSQTGGVATYYRIVVEATD